MSIRGPELLLATVSAVLTAVTLIYGSYHGFLSSLLIYLYILLRFFAAWACAEFTSTAYTIAGAVAALVWLLFVKLLDPILGTVIGIVAAFTVFYVTEAIAKCDWRYFAFGVFHLDFSGQSTESSLQMRYDQHVPVGDETPRSVLKTEPPENLETDQQKRTSQPKKNVKFPPPKKEKKAEAKKQRKDGKKS